MGQEQQWMKQKNYYSLSNNIDEKEKEKSNGSYKAFLN